MSNKSFDKMVLLPHEVREILNSDNNEIIKLCKMAEINPKQNEKGLTYFSYDEVKRLKELREKRRQDVVNSGQYQALSNIKEVFEVFEDAISNNVTQSINGKFEKIEEFFEEFAQYKSENESLKLKIAQISKENCYLKDQLSEFKPVGMGVYFKTKRKDYSI